VSNRVHVHVYRLDELSDRAVEGMPARPSSGLRTHSILPTSPNPDRRRAPELLAASREGATEAIMRAPGFKSSR
jgi:hypothetical protein